MRTPIASKSGIRARAISGTHTVLIALDATATARKGLLGFALRREDPTEDEEYWLRGSKVFPTVIPKPAQGDLYSTLEHPIQSFLWGDYTAKPGRTYHYTIRPLYGTPKKLEPGGDVKLDVTTEPEKDNDGDVHGVWFNRGAIASRAYADKFKNAAPPKPEDPDDKHTAWLSRGLVEACLKFIDETKKGQKLRVAAYEFTYQPVLKALKRAITRGVDVKIVVESGKETVKGKKVDTAATKANRKAIKTAKLPATAIIKRTKRTKIPHNKFIVRETAGGKAVSVWTGSTNFTESGFLGQSNVGHRIDDDAVAACYSEFWKALAKNPEPSDAKVSCMTITPTPVGETKKKSMTCIFSPRSDSKMLKWYADRIDGAGNTVMFTAAFSVDDSIGGSLAKDRDFLRFVLMEKPPTRKVATLFKGDRDIVVAYGNVLGQTYLPNKKGELTLRRNIPDFKLDEWFLKEEHFRKTGHVFFVHLKVLLVDPLTTDPLVCTGSANFSKPSLSSNDENMLLVRGNTRVADIYLTEFDRLLRHFYFRDMAAELHKKGDDAKSKFLDEKGTWVGEHFSKNGMKSRRRQMFFP
jgi:phosphatidylserine/phosphatidylglycerophosphate/cardiolipin synthase-like enzyme